MRIIDPPAPWKPGCLLVAWLILFTPMVLAQSPEKMDDVIRHVRYRAHPQSAVSLEEITARLPGSQELTLRALLKQWLGLKRYFNQVEFSSMEWTKNEDESFSGEVEILVSELIEKVVFRGNNSLEEARLMKLRELWENTSPKQRKPLGDEIISLYFHEGYYGISLKTEAVQGKIANYKTIVYHINEGPKFKIRHYSVNGNQRISSEEINEVLSEFDLTDAAGEARRKRLNAIGLLYQSRGYLNMSIKESPILVKGSDRLMDIQLVIHEGKQVIARSVQFEMEGITLSPEELSKIIETSPKKPVLHSALVSDSTRITDFVRKHYGQEVSVKGEVMPEEDDPWVQFQIRKYRPMTINEFHFPSGRYLPNLAADIRDIVSAPGKLSNTNLSLTHLYRNPLADKIHEGYSYYTLETFIPYIQDAQVVVAEGRSGSLDYGLSWSSLFSHRLFFRVSQKRFSFDWPYLDLGEIYTKYKLEIDSDYHTALWKWYENGFMGRPLYLGGTLDHPDRQEQDNAEAK